MVIQCVLKSRPTGYPSGSGDRKGSTGPVSPLPAAIMVKYCHLPISNKTSTTMAGRCSGQTQRAQSGIQGTVQIGSGQTLAIGYRANEFIGCSENVYMYSIIYLSTPGSPRSGPRLQIFDFMDGLNESIQLTWLG